MEGWRHCKSLREAVTQQMFDLRRCGGDGQTYAGGYADACHMCADDLEKILKRRFVKTTRKRTRETNR